MELLATHASPASTDPTSITSGWLEALLTGAGVGFTVIHDGPAETCPADRTGRRAA